MNFLFDGRPHPFLMIQSIYACIVLDSSLSLTPFAEVMTMPAFSLILSLGLSLKYSLNFLITWQRVIFISNMANF